MKSCSNCEHSSTITEESGQRTLCQRFPPVPVSLITTGEPRLFPTPAGTFAIPTIKTDVFAIFPTVQPDFKCGEHKPTE